MGGIEIKKNGKTVLTPDEQRLEQVKRRHERWKKEGRIPEDTPEPTLKSIKRPNEE